MSITDPQLWMPHAYQRTAVQFLHNRTTLNPEGQGGAALFLDPGLGKTSICLEYLQQLKEFGYAHRALIIAPMRVVYDVWPEQVQQWTNFRSLSYTIVHGTAKVRRKRLATQVNMHIINREGVTWLAKQYAGRKVLPWQVVFVDESTSFKKWTAGRTKALRSFIEKIPYRVIMTGTPAPKNAEDLFAQAWLMDQGKALGVDLTTFRNQCCYLDGRPDLNNYKVKEELRQSVIDRIEHMCLRLDAKDHLSIPPITYHDIQVRLPEQAMDDYRSMEDLLFLALANGGAREAVNAGAKYSLCRQISNGGMYDENHVAHEIHRAKTDAALDLIDELGGKPVLMFHQFDHDAQRLNRVIKDLVVIRGGMKPREVSLIIERWNAGDIQVMSVQPQALSYGVNLQSGPCRDILWLGPTDSLETYIQANARIYRQGVQSAVRVHRLCCRDTIDELIWSRIDEREDVQGNLLNILRDYARRRQMG